MEIQISNFRFINIIFSILYLIWDPNISKSSESLEEVEEVFSSKFFISGHCAEISALEQKIGKKCLMRPTKNVPDVCKYFPATS